MRHRAAMLALVVGILPAVAAPVPKAKPVVPLAEKLDRPPPAPRELAAELAGWDSTYRHGSEEKFVGLEKFAEEMAKQSESDHDQARVWYMVAHVAAQSGIDKQAERVRKYADKCLKLSRDPLDRSYLYSCLASCEELEKGEFADRRRKAAEWLLTGYTELLYQELPDGRPFVPEVGKFCLGGDDAPRLRAVMAAQMAARDEALFVAFQVSARTQLVRQLRNLYEPNAKVHGHTADGPDELRKLAEAKLPTTADVDKLMERVLPEK